MKSAFVVVFTLAVYLLLVTVLPIPVDGPAKATPEEPARSVVLGTSTERGRVSTPEITGNENENVRSFRSAEPLNAVIGDEQLLEVVPVSSVNLESAMVIEVPAVAGAVETAQSAGFPQAVDTTSEDQALLSFMATVINGKAGQVVGVYIPGVFALPVVQQPFGQAGYVSEIESMLTQFEPSSAYGTIGLLAHNYLSGRYFFDLREFQEVVIVYGDGELSRFRVSKIQHFQALTPTSVYSNFIDLADPEQKQITASDLFNQVYTAPGQVVFQTCIEAYGDLSWGRVFITAERVDE